MVRGARVCSQSAPVRAWTQEDGENGEALFCFPCSLWEYCHWFPNSQDFPSLLGKEGLNILRAAFIDKAPRGAGSRVLGSGRGGVGSLKWRWLSWGGRRKGIPHGSWALTLLPPPASRGRGLAFFPSRICQCWAPKLYAFSP